MLTFRMQFYILLNLFEYADVSVFINCYIDFSIMLCPVSQVACHLCVLL
jgi:hypothetical protein